MALAYSPRVSDPFTLTAGQTGPLTQDWILFSSDDLDVRRRRAGVIEDLVVGIDFTVSGVGDQDGFAVDLLEGAEEGDEIVLVGAREVSRDTTITSERAVTPTLINKDFDIVYAQMQEATREGARSFKTSLFDPNVFDLEGRRLQNIADPQDDGDAVNLGSIQQALNDATTDATATAIAAAGTATGAAGAAAAAAGSATAAANAAGEAATAAGDAAGNAASAAGSAAGAQTAAEEARDAAIAAAAGAAAGSGYATIALAAAATPETAPAFMRIEGYHSAGDGGAALYRLAGSEPSHAGKYSITLDDGVTVAWYEIAELNIRPEMLGAVGDGVTGDAAAFQGALGVLAAIGGGTLVCSAKTYSVDGTLSWPSNVSLALNGAELNFANAVTPSGGNYIEAIGTADAPLALTVDVAAGGRTIPVASTATLSVGDMLRLFSTSVFDPLRTASYCGELVFIESLTGTTITTTADIQDNYTVAATARVERIVPVEGILLQGPGRIVGSPAQETSSNAVALWRAKGCRIEGISFSEVDLAHVRLRDAVDCTVAFNSFGITRPTSQGYGVSFTDATQDCSAVHNVFDGCRHSLSTNNNGVYGGVPRRILFESNVVRFSVFALGGSMGGGDAIDTHAAADDITIRNNTIMGSSGLGINVECPNVVIEGNLIEDCASHGIRHHNETPRPGTARIANNTIRRCGTATSVRGIMVSPGVSETTSYCKQLQILDNKISDVAGSAIEVAGTAAFPQLGAIIANNTVRNCDGVGGVIYCQWCRYFQVIGNIVAQNPVLGVSVRITNCKNGSVANNVIECVGSATINAIQVSAASAGDSTELAFVGNSIHCNSATATRRGILLDNTVTETGVYCNVIQNATAAITLGSGTGNAQANNI